MNLTITRSVVADAERLDFLPKHCGNAFPDFEHAVYSFARTLSSSYNGGFWQFYECSNGAFFIAPDSNCAFQVFVPGNGFEGDLSAEAFGITVTLFALGYLAVRDSTMVEKYDLLMDFLMTSPESELITRAID